VIVGAVLLAVSFGAAAPGTRATAVSPSSAAGLGLVKLRTQGLESALSGRYAEGLAQLRRVAKVKPGDPIVTEALPLLESYLERWGRAATQRNEEYEAAVLRVGWCGIAQAYVEKADAEQLKKLREAVNDVVRAYNDAGTADQLHDAADAEAAEQTRKTSIEALGKSIDAAKKVRKLLTDDEADYAKTFRPVVDETRKLLDEHRQAWREAVTDEPRQWRLASRRLKVLEYRESQALTDLESMTFDKPWRIGLAQARLARRLLEDKERLAGEKWFTSLVAATESRGEGYVKDANWDDALSAYGALEELLPDSEEVQTTVKTVQRHVRVLGLYGHSDPNAQPDDGNEPLWRQLVENVDVDMVRKAIRQLNQAYVSPIDYRKVIQGGLRGIKVLAETPQVAHTFPGLKDDTKRGKFLKAIELLIRDAEERDRLDDGDLVIALNSVVAASDETVDIPVGVLAVEFTDGFLDELDKFSAMIWPHSVPDFEKRTMGRFHGVGIQITKEPGEPLRVVTPLVGSPAFRAGIKAGDLIVKVSSPPKTPKQGVRTEKLPIDKLVDLIMGKQGTKVCLTIKRGGREKDYTIIRDKIHIRTVKGWQREPKSGQWDYFLDPGAKIGYLRLTQFTDQTAGNLAAALRQMKADGARSVVLDLRFNPGGLLRSAAKVADEFLYAGRIVSTRGRRGRQLAELKASPVGQFLDGDLVVLVNQYSASAAEIVSGALKDWKRARIVGQRTYGKGSVQHVMSIRDHRALLKLTTAYYYLPRGRLLHRKNGAKDWGVDPDVEVMVTPNQMRQWLDIRRKTDIVQEVNEQQLREELVRQYDSDLQLNTAVLMLKLMQLRDRSAAA